MITHPHHPIPERIELQAWNLASRLNSQMDGQPPSKGWLLTIQNQTEESVQQAFNLAYRLNHKIKTKTRWQLPWIVSYHPFDGHPSSKGQGWSPIIPGIVTYQPYVGHQLCRIMFPNIIAQLPKDGHPQSQAWSPTIQNNWNLIKPSDSN